MKVVKICTNEFINESRDCRELSAYRECGADVVVVAKEGSAANTLAETVDSFEVHRQTTRPFGDRFPNAVNRFGSLFTWARYVRTLNPDVISGHDLIGTLIGWLAIQGGKRGKPVLIYDSHEFELGRNATRSVLKLRLLKIIEGFAIKKSDATIVVNDSIANELQNIYKLKKRPFVVRNVPERWTINETECLDVRKEIMGDRDCPWLISYHGLVVQNRGIESMIEMVAEVPDVLLLVLGDAPDSHYLDGLMQLAESLKIKDRVVFHPAVPHGELWRFVGAADISMVMISPGAAKIRSYYLSLPNKLFEGIQSNVPIIGADIPEIRNIVEKYQVGKVCPYDSVEEIIATTKDMINNQSQYKKYKENTRIASKELCWENEKKVLIDMYRQLVLNKNTV